VISAPSTTTHRTVVHVLGALRHSGAELMLLSAAESFAQQGIESLLVAMAEERESTLNGRLRQASGMRTRHLPTSNWWTFTSGYIRLLRQVKPSCVHVHAEHASPLTSLVPRLFGIRVVRTVHSSFGFEGPLRARKRLERAVARLTGVRFVTISRSVHDNELDRFRNRSRLILNWYDDRLYRTPTAHERAHARETLGISAQRVAVALVGNCSVGKNHAAVFQALSTIEVDRRPLLLHAGDERAQPTERELCLSLGIDGDVSFLGPTDDIRSVLFAADAFVMPSFYEGMSVAALEAHATGLPLLLARSPGLTDFAAYFRSCAYFEAADTAEIRQLFLKTAVLDAEDVQRLERDRSSRDIFGLDRGVSDYLDEYGF
jgi:glycosyltransferase involved in cell wall biosynthesis